MTTPPRPAPARLDPARADYAAILAAHRDALERRSPTYRDPSTGFLVMTYETLAARGECCAGGCRHCPWA